MSESALHPGCLTWRWGLLLLGLLLTSPAAARQVPYDTTSTVRMRVPEVDVRRAYRDDPAFQYTPTDERADAPGLRERIRAWLADFLRDLNESTGGTLTVVFLVGLAGLGAALIVQLFLLDARRPWHRTDSHEAREAERSHPSSDPVDFRARAEAARRAGQLRAATRWLYRTLLQELAEADLITYHPDRTNTAYVRAVRERAGTALADEVARATRQFEYVWYGGFEATEAELDVLQTAIERIRAFAPRSS